MKEANRTGVADRAVARRDFLKIAGVAAPAAVAALAMAPGQAEAATASSQAAGGTLQDTAHTRTYYRLARF